MERLRALVAPDDRRSRGAGAIRAGLFAFLFLLMQSVAVVHATATSDDPEHDAVACDVCVAAHRQHDVAPSDDVPTLAPPIAERAPTVATLEPIPYAAPLAAPNARAPPRG